MSCILAGMTDILIALTSNDQLGDTGRSTGFTVVEAAYPWEVFSAHGHTVTVASVRGTATPDEWYDPSDSTQAAFLREFDVRHTTRLTDVEGARYGAVFYAGGHGTMWDFPDDEDVIRVGREVYDNGGVVSAVCHGPAALVNMTLSDGSYLVDGKRVTGFTNEEEDAAGLLKIVPFLLADTLNQRGASHSGGPAFQPHVVTDGRLVTGQNPQSARAAGEAVVSALESATS